jgi:general nucleoside transport system permease protein
MFEWLSHTLDWNLVTTTVRMVAPILLAALGGLLCSKVGIFNIALEGMLLTGAFGAVSASYLTSNAWAGVLGGIVAATLVALILAVVTVDLKADPVVAGVAVNLMAVGLTTFALRTVFHVTGTLYDPRIAGLPVWMGQSPLVWLSWLLVPVVWLYLFRTVTGLRLRAVGEMAVGASSVGVSVRGHQYAAVLLSGVFCGLAGAQLSLGQVHLFMEEMSAGRGFIALVAVLFGQAHPFGVFGSSLLFGLMEALSTRLQGTGIPTGFTQMVPYVATLVAMFFFGKQRSTMSAER